MDREFQSTDEEIYCWGTEFQDDLLLDLDDLEEIRGQNVELDGEPTWKMPTISYNTMLGKTWVDKLKQEEANFEQRILEAIEEEEQSKMEWELRKSLDCSDDSGMKSSAGVVIVCVEDGDGAVDEDGDEDNDLLYESRTRREGFVPMWAT